jgi:hypothetical protein
MLVDEIATKVETPTEEKKEIPVDPAAQAAAHLPGMLAYYRDLIEGNKFCGTHAKQVLVAIAETPFQLTKPEFTTNEQYTAYNLGLAIEAAKFKIFMAGLRDQANKANEQQISESSEETKKEGNENGN